MTQFNITNQEDYSSLEEKANVSQYLSDQKSYLQELAEEHMGVTFLGEAAPGAFGSWVGYAAARSTYESGLAGSTYDAYGDTPLNWEDPEPGGTSQLLGPQNDKAGIMAILDSIPMETWSWVLDGDKTYRDFRDRADLVHMASPQYRAQGSTSGRVLGYVADTNAIIALTLVTEAAMLAALPASLASASLTGTTIGRTLGGIPAGGKTVTTIAGATTTFAGSVARSSGIARYAALGLIDETVIRGASELIDPTHNWEGAWKGYLMSAGIGGTIGAWAFRARMRETFIEYALASHRTTVLGDGILGLPMRINPADLGSIDGALLGVARSTEDVAAQLATAAQHMRRAGTLGRYGDELDDVLTAVSNTTDTLLIAGLPNTAENLASVAWAYARAHAEGLSGLENMARVRQLLVQGLSARSAATADELNALLEHVVVDISAQLELSYNAGIRNQYNVLHGVFAGREVRPDTMLPEGGLGDEVTGRHGIFSRVLNHIFGDRVPTQLELARSVVDIRRIIRNAVDTDDALVQLNELAGGTMEASELALFRGILREARRPASETRALLTGDVGSNARDALEFAMNPEAANLRALGQALRPDANLNSAGAYAGMDASVPRLTHIDTGGWLQKFLHQGANILRHENPTVRVFAYQAMWVRRSMAHTDGRPATQGLTMIEVGRNNINSWVSAIVVSERNNRWAHYLNLAPGEAPTTAQFVSNYMRVNSNASTSEFSALVFQRVRSGVRREDAIQRAADEILELNRQIHKHAQAMGLRGFLGNAQPNYLPRSWKFEHIRRLATTPTGRTQLIQFARAALETGKDAAGLPARTIMDENGAVVMVADLDAASIVFADALINISRRAESSPLLDIDAALDNAINNLDANVFPPGGARTPHGRGRVLLNESASGGGLDMGALTVTDIIDVHRRYIVSVQGALNEHQLLRSLEATARDFGFTGPNGGRVEFENFESYFGFVNKVGSEFSRSRDIVDVGTRGSMDEVLAALRYEPLHRSAADMGIIGRVGDRIMPLLLGLGYLARGGLFALSAASETSRIIGLFSAASIWRQLPAIRDLARNIHTGREIEPTENLMALIMGFAGSANDRLNRILFHTGRNAFEGASGVEPMRGTNLMQRATNAFSDISGLAHITMFEQALTGGIAVQSLVDVFGGHVGRMDAATARLFGLDPQQYDNLVNAIGEHAVVNARGRVIDIRPEFFNLPEADALKMFITRTTSSTIQDVPTRGDFGRWAFTWWGRAGTQFRTFNLKGIDNFLLKNGSLLRRGDIHTQTRVAGEITATILVAGLIKYAVNYGKYQGLVMRDKHAEAREFKKRFLGARGFIQGAATGPAELYIPVALADNIYTSLLSDDPLFSPYRLSGLGYGFLDGTPIGSFGSTVSGVAADIYGDTVAKHLPSSDKRRRFSEQSLERLKKLLPGQNMPGISHWMNIGVDETTDYWNLPSKSTIR